MKLYIAGPMTGLPDLNYPAFMEAEETLRWCGYEVANPARVDEIHLRELKKLSLGNSCSDCCNGIKHTWRWYMNKTIAMMLECDGVALLDGWEGSRGAMIEFKLAASLGMRCIRLSNCIPILPSLTINAWANLQAEGGDKESSTVEGAAASERWNADVDNM